LARKPMTGSPRPSSRTTKCDDASAAADTRSVAQFASDRWSGGCAGGWSWRVSEWADRGWPQTAKVRRRRAGAAGAAAGGVRGMGGLASG
jgi:hypothetical protein